MNVLFEIAGGGIVLLGIAYVVLPRRVYHFGFDFLRDDESEPSPPAAGVLWLHRCIGVFLVVIGVSYVF